MKCGTWDICSWAKVSNCKIPAIIGEIAKWCEENLYSKPLPLELIGEIAKWCEENN